MLVIRQDLSTDYADYADYAGQAESRGHRAWHMIDFGFWIADFGLIDKTLLLDRMLDAGYLLISLTINRQANSLETKRAFHISLAMVLGERSFDSGV